MVVQEHWLWPFELDQLGSIDPDFAYTAVCDSHLSPSSTFTRGCGGCSILWRKSISAVPISNLDSDRICGIQLPIEGSELLTIIGAYMPSSEYPQETYNIYITAVNQVISTVPPSSPLLLAGDLNCHIGKLGGPRSLSDPNHRGVQWMELIDNHSLYIPSLSQPWPLVQYTLSTQTGLQPLWTMSLETFHCVYNPSFLPRRRRSST